METLVRDAIQQVLELETVLMETEVQMATINACGERRIQEIRSEIAVLTSATFVG